MTQSPPTTAKLYTPLLELGAGGMGRVIVAHRGVGHGVEQLVVLKQLHAHLLGERELIELFRREARLSSQVRHANVVPVHDVVEEADGTLLLVSDYVESVSLSQLLRELNAHQERLPPPIAARIVSDMLAGLHAAHEAVDLEGRPLGIVHRDVSPQNLLIGVDGVSRLIDFGIAKAVETGPTTGAGHLRGKLQYMSPEQLTHHAVDRRADVFAAGAVVSEVFTGKRLFDASGDADIATQILFGSAPTLDALDASLVERLKPVLGRALARSRDERFATAHELQVALEAVMPPAPQREVAELVAKRCAGTLVERRKKLQAQVSRAKTTPPTRPPRRRLIVAAAAATVGVSALVTWLVLHAMEPVPPPPATPVAKVEPTPAPPAPRAEPQEQPRQVEPPKPADDPPPREKASAPRTRRAKHAPALHKNPYEP